MTRSPPRPAQRIAKRYGYLMFLSAPLAPILAFALAQRFGFDDAWAFAPLVYFYLIVPLFDYLIGTDSINPGADTDALSADPYFRVLVYACVPLMIASLCAGAWLFVNWTELSWLGRVGWVMSYGFVGAVLSINAAHELIHKSSRFEQRLGGLLLCMVCYASFKIEHVRGHHVNVSTPKDPSSARYNQSLYTFLVPAIFHNVSAAWRLERKRLAHKQQGAWSSHNELLRWYALTLIVIAALTVWLGTAGLIFFLAQSLGAIVVLETVNYLEHYGLRRRQLANGRYERTTHQHSWNSNHLLSNLLLFQLQRHSDHHANPKRRYQILRHFDDSPQLPAGYATMVIVAWIPWLWRRVMNPRVEAYYRQTPELLELQRQGL